ncbi:MAG: alpha/beta fold hydrolase [Verrucomicrobiota bacterium]
MLAFALTSRAAPAASAEPETIVLLHGLGRTRFSMTPLAFALERQGYRVVNLNYRSRTVPLETLSTEWLPARLAELSPAPTRLHFVTHSMGGILVRLWLRECGVPSNLGRVVMLGPPNHGSELADRLSPFRTFRWLAGINAPRLGTTADSLARQLGDWPSAEAELGVLAGSRSIIPFLPLPAPHDGKVTLASTHLDGERDHRTLPISHTLLPYDRAARSQVVAFLRTGAFVH